jgi:hypothetical protein
MVGAAGDHREPGELPAQHWDLSKTSKKDIVEGTRKSIAISIERQAATTPQGQGVKNPGPASLSRRETKPLSQSDPRTDRRS